MSAVDNVDDDDDVDDVDDDDDDDDRCETCLTSISTSSSVYVWSRVRRASSPSTAPKEVSTYVSILVTGLRNS
jgi:hypothetical protein